MYLHLHANLRNANLTDIQVNLFPLPKIQEPRDEHSALPQANMVTTEYQTYPQNML